MKLTTANGVTPEQRLASLGLELPPAAGAVAAYESWAIAGSMLYTSGQLPWIAGDLKFAGKIGRELTPEQGYAACQLGALNALAQIKAALGGFKLLKRVIRLEGSLNVAAGFNATPAVLNGASHLLNEVFGDRGKHTRMIHAMPEMPLDCACLIVLWAEIESI